MDLSVLPSYFLNAVALGLFLGLLGVGLTLVFGFLDIVNFAHGSMYMLGAYIGFQIYVMTQQFWLSLLIAPVVMAVFGYLLKTLLLNRLRQQDPIYVILLTYGVAIFIENVVKQIWSADIRAIDTPPLLSGAISLFGTGYPIYRLFMIGFLLVVVVAIYYIFNKTNLGIMIRAGTEDREMASALGINTKTVGVLIFTFATALAALVGVVTAPDRALDPTLGVTVLTNAFIVMVIGGMKSLTGTMVAGLLVGFIQTFGGIFFADLIVVFTLLLMILILLKNQHGLGAVFKR